MGEFERAGMDGMKRYLVKNLVVLLLGGLVAAGCGVNGDDSSVVLPDESILSLDEEDYRVLVRLGHITDAQVVDEESPGRLAIFDNLVSVAWRPQEAYSAHLLDGAVRAVNRYHREVAPVDFLIHTGDALDNAQGNELRWFLQVLDGGQVNPLSGMDDRGGGRGSGAGAGSAPSVRGGRGVPAGATRGAADDTVVQRRGES